MCSAYIVHKLPRCGGKVVAPRVKEQKKEKKKLEDGGRSGLCFFLRVTDIYIYIHMRHARMHADGAMAGQTQSGSYYVYIYILT